MQSPWKRPRPPTYCEYFHWLVTQNALTPHIKKYSDWSLIVSFQGYQKLLKDEKTYFFGKIGYIREVLQFANNIPIIFARTVVLKADGPWRSLKQLNKQPLGSLLFTNPKIHRISMQYQRLYNYYPLKRKILLIEPELTQRLWARRSLFSLQSTFNSPLLLTEVFLPGILDIEKKPKKN